MGLSIPLFNMVNLLLIRDPLEIAFKYPRPTLPAYMTPIEPQVGKFYNSPVALGSGAGAVLTVPIAALGAKLTRGHTVGLPRGVSGIKKQTPTLLSPPFLFLFPILYQNLVSHCIFSYSSKRKPQMRHHLSPSKEDKH